MQIKNFTDIKGLLFDNKTANQTIFKNTVWLAAADGINKLLRLVLLIYVARILGATEYGKFSFALAFIALFAVLSNLGLPRIVVREFSREKEKENDFAAILSLKTILGVLALVFVLIGSFFVTMDPGIRKIIWILAVYAFLDGIAGFMNLFFQARQRMEYEAMAKIFQEALLVGFSFFVIFLFPSTENLSYGYLLATLISLLFILLFFHFKIYPIRFDWNVNTWRRYLVLSWPIALSGILITIYGQIDSVMMGHWNLITETGWYNAASRILAAALIPFTLLSTSFFPVLSRTLKESEEKFQKVWNKQMGIVISGAVPLVAGGMVLAPKIIGFIYGRDYAPSILAFQILIIMTGIVLFQTPLYQTLLIFNQQKKFFLVALLGAVINFILNLILIPKYSLYGAAISSVATAFVILALYAGLTRYFTSVKLFNLKLFGTGIISLFSTLIMYFLISNHRIYNLHIFLSMFIGAMIYFSVFLGFLGLKLVLGRVHL